jgi:branched-chain amino acid transport system substrate-binding protein
MRSGKRSWLLGTIFGAAALVVGNVAPAAAAPATGEPILINVVECLTGYAAFLGKGVAAAMKIEEQAVNAEGGINGRPVHFVFYDDQSNPQQTVEIMSQLMANNPAVIMGSQLVSSCNAQAAMVPTGPVVYCLSPGLYPKAGSYVYSAGVSTQEMLVGLMTYFRGRGFTKIAMINSTDASGEDGQKQLHAVLAMPENKDVTLVSDQQFNTNDLSVTAQIDRIKSSGAQALIVWTTGSPAGTVMQAIVQSGLNIPIGITAGDMTFEQMQHFKAFLPKELYFVSSVWPAHVSPQVKLPQSVVAAQTLFYDAFQKYGHTRPSEAVTIPWDASEILFDALRKFGPGVTVAQMNGYISHLTDYGGVDGIYNFVTVPQRGLSAEDTLVTQWNPQENAWDAVSQAGGAPLPGSTNASAE